MEGWNGRGRTVLVPNPCEGRGATLAGGVVVGVVRTVESSFDAADPVGAVVSGPAGEAGVTDEEAWVVAGRLRATAAAPAPVATTAPATMPPVTCRTNRLPCSRPTGVAISVQSAVPFCDVAENVVNLGHHPGARSRFTRELDGNGSLDPGAAGSKDETSIDEGNAPVTA